MSTVSRLQLFLDVASELGDLITLTADADGSTTTFTSSADMLWQDSGLDGREAWYVSNNVASASNAAKRRVVTSTDQDTATITVSPAWPAASKSGDVLYLVNGMGTGVTIPEIHAKINQLIRRVRDELATETADTAVTFDATDPVLDIPTGWKYFLGIQVELNATLTGVWSILPGEPYTVSLADSPRTVTPHPRVRGLLHTKRVRLIGATPLAELSTDSATTTAPAGWLAKTAAYELKEAAATRTGDVATALTFGELLKVQQQELAGYVGKRFSAVGRRIDLGQ